MNSFLPKSVIAITAAASVLFSGTYVAGGNMPGWGSLNTTNQPQVQQPGQPLVSEPAPVPAQTEQPPPPGSWSPPRTTSGTTSSPTVSTPTQQPGISAGTSPAQPGVSTSSPGVRPHTNTFIRTAPSTAIRSQQTGPAGIKTQWDRWSELAFEATIMAVNYQWKLQATIQNVRISAVAAICPSLCLRGPDLGPTIKSFLLSNEVPAQVADIFANSIAGAWKDWQDSVTIPGLPWYPAFAAFPGPQAPPTPNVPMPLITLSKRQTDLNSSERLAARIFEQFRGTEISPDARDAINSFARQFSSSFLIWLSTAQVQGVMGQGPVPTFAPPYVPVGPVVNGTVIPRPGVITGNLH